MSLVESLKGIPNDRLRKRFTMAYVSAGALKRLYKVFIQISGGPTRWDERTYKKAKNIIDQIQRAEKEAFILHAELRKRGVIKSAL